MELDPVLQDRQRSLTAVPDAANVHVELAKDSVAAGALDAGDRFLAALGIDVGDDNRDTFVRTAFCRLLTDSLGCTGDEYSSPVESGCRGGCYHGLTASNSVKKVGRSSEPSSIRC